MTDIIDGKLPKTHTATLYILLRVSGRNEGEISIFDCDISSSSDQYILLDTVEYTFKIPEIINLKDVAIKGLENEKTKLKAEFHMKLKDIQDKIDNLFPIKCRGEAA